MKRYEAPEWTYTAVEPADVITSSGEGERVFLPNDKDQNGDQWGGINPGIPLN